MISRNQTLGRAVLVGGIVLAFSVLVRAAEEPRTAGKRFNAAYQKLVQADAFRDRQEWSKATALYQDALQSYQALATKYPDWQPGVVRFRISYCNNQVESMMRRYEADADAPPRPSASGEVATASFPLIPAGDALATGRALILAGDPENARVALLQGLQQDPDDPDIRLLLAVAQCRAAKYDDAAFIAEQLVVDTPSNAVARLVLATAYMGIHEMAAAEQELRRAIELDPSSAPAHLNLAQLFLLRTPPDVEAARKAYAAARRMGAEADPELERQLEP